jgi:hypothetical protein
MASDRIVSTAFWSHEDVEPLNGIEKSVYLYLMTAPNSNLCGLYDVTVSTIAYHTGWTSEQVLQALNTLIEDKKVYYDSGVVFVKNLSNGQKAEKFGGFKHHVKKISNDLRKPKNKAYAAFTRKFRTLLEGFSNPSGNEVSLPNPSLKNEPSGKGSRTLIVKEKGNKEKKNKNLNDDAKKTKTELTPEERAETKKAIALARSMTKGGHISEAIPQSISAMTGV